MKLWIGTQITVNLEENLCMHECDYPVTETDLESIWQYDSVYITSLMKCQDLRALPR